MYLSISEKKFINSVTASSRLNCQSQIWFDGFMILGRIFQLQILEKLKTKNFLLDKVTQLIG